MSKIGIFILAVAALAQGTCCFSEEPQVSLQAAREYGDYSSRIVKKVPIPRGYHEALLVNGTDMWVTNGKNGKVWVIDMASGSVKNEIEPVAGFTEGITGMPGGIYAVADWDQMKIFKVQIVNSKMFSVAEVSVAPSHPAGVLWNGSRLYVVAWTRGMGTKFELIEMDDRFNTIRRIDIGRIQEPAHLTWDGRYIWISSWFSRAVYKVDPSTWTILGEASSPVPKTTGIAWDANRLWLTGTYSDLYQLEISGA